MPKTRTRPKFRSGGKHFTATRQARVARAELGAAIAVRYGIVQAAPAISADALEAALVSPLDRPVPDAPRIPTQQEADAVADAIRDAVAEADAQARITARVEAAQDEARSQGAGPGLVAGVAADERADAEVDEAARRKREAMDRRNAAKRAARAKAKESASA